MLLQLLQLLLLHIGPHCSLLLLLLQQQLLLQLVLLLLLRLLRLLLHARMQLGTPGNMIISISWQDHRTRQKRRHNSCLRFFASAAADSRLGQLLLRQDFA